MSRIAKDLWINEKVVRLWMQAYREAAGSEVQVFSGHGRRQDAELS